jgi:transposase InsO family protein
LWQADVTYLHIPEHDWWYEVTIIDYYSRYLLAYHFTPSYRAQDVTAALDEARAEAERWHGSLEKTPFLVTNNGSSFLTRHFRTHIDGQYRTQAQLGLPDRSNQTLKTEEVYWRLSRSPGDYRESLEGSRQRYNDVRPHWALIPTVGGDPVTPTDAYFYGQAVQLPRWQSWAKTARKKLEDMVADTLFPIASGEVATAVVTWASEDSHKIRSGVSTWFWCQDSWWLSEYFSIC